MKEFLFLLNYLLLFTILMIRGYNVRISIVIYRRLVALETTRGRCKCSDCLPTVVNTIFLRPKKGVRLISRNVSDFMTVYILKSLVNDREKASENY